MMKISTGAPVRATTTILRAQGGPDHRVEIAAGQAGSIVRYEEHPFHAEVAFIMPTGQYRYVQWTGRGGQEAFERDIQTFSGGQKMDKAKVRITGVYYDDSERTETFVVEANSDKQAETRALVRAQREFLNADDVRSWEIASVNWVDDNPASDLAKIKADRLARGES